MTDSEITNAPRVGLVILILAFAYAFFYGG